ncbi:hypothetical protein J0X14_13555 [Muricauda sp. CAU 1633]|uniref:hypothetical protein n=1 Tax=Allomuricauda sp. CAU 1633 TaxID=2816036 RepID=UPI001A907220|nr:hypothetical protein [Muricauda sp. CAU 1633]MBO0323329.1 hypothetical protein [Muricauda sp. CAU 1633]
MKKLIIPTLVVLLFSCDKEDEKTETTSEDVVNALTEYVTVNKVFQDIGNNNGDAVLSAENSTSTAKSNSVGKTAPDVEITISPADFVTFPKTITVDFKTGVLGKDGITRKGKVTIISTNWYREPGSIHTATFTDYYHNDYKVEGTHVVENTGENVDGFLEYTVVITNGKITKSDGSVIEYQENSTRTWIEGKDTPLNIWDDEYLLDGSQNGTSSSDLDYTLTVEESLHFILLPRNIEFGILDVDIADIENIKINYANSTITILGKTYPFVK